VAILPESSGTAPGLDALPEPARHNGEALQSNHERTLALMAACRAVADAQGITLLTAPAIEASAAPPDEQLQAQITSIAAANRFRCRRVELHRNWWRSNHGPLLAFLDDQRQPVALLPQSGRSYQMLDGKTGNAIEVNQTNAGRLARHGCSFTKPFPARALGVWEFLRLSAEGCRPDLTRILWAAAAAGLLTLAIPTASATVFDTLIPEADRPAVVQLTALLCGIAVCGAMFRLTSSIAALRVQAKMEATSQAGIWDRLLSLRPSFFRRYSVGDLADRAMGMNQMRLILTDSILSAMFAAVFSLFSFALLFFFSMKLAMIVLAAAIISAVITAWAGWREIRCQRALSDATGRTNSLVIQLLTGITKLRVAGAEGRAFAVWSRRFAGQQRLALASRQIVARLIAFQSGFSIIVVAVILATMTTLVAMPGGAKNAASGNPVLATGQFLAFLTAAGTFLAASAAVSGALVKAIRVIPLYERARPLLQALPESDTTKTDPGKLTGKIEFADVTFSYGDGSPTIRGVNFTISPGEFVAIVGSTGSGKSTLLRLLLGFEQPAQGSIRYDGRDLASLDAPSVRRQLGVVLQSGGLFPGSIFMNIVGSLPLTMDNAWEAARLAGIDETIRQMPMGMFSYVSEGGATLSGGQRQQLLLARALAAHPRIFLLDEATSALDNLSQSRVIRSLEAVSSTRLVIAHRLSTVRNADRILVMDRGSIVQVGTYQQLSTVPGLFRELAQRQTN
jgi:ATP-binding cassette subfamily C protein